MGFLIIFMECMIIIVIIVDVYFWVVNFDDKVLVIIIIGLIGKYMCINCVVIKSMIDN